MTRLTDPSLHSHVDCGAAPSRGTTAPANSAPETADPSLSGSDTSQAFVASFKSVIPSSDSEKPISGETTNAPGFTDPSRRDPSKLGEQPQLPACGQGRLPLKESLGRTGSVTIFGGSILILLGIGFLSLLWFGYGDEPEAAEAPWIWRQIAVHDWMTRASK